MAEKKVTKKKAAKKAAAKVRAGKKVAAKKAAVKKPVAKKPAPRKTPAKRSAAAKRPAKKAASSPIGGRLKVTLVRSTIATPARHRLWVKSLGLRRVNHTVEVEDTPAIRGLLNHAAYLVRVE